MRIFYKFKIPIYILISAIAIQATEFDLGCKLGTDNIGLPHYRGTGAPKGITAGFFLEQHLSDINSFQLDLGYSYRERQWYRDYFWYTGHYINMAALAKVFPPGQSRIVPYIYIGPVFTVLAHGGTRGTLPDQMDNYYFESDRLYFGYTIGGGFDFNAGGLSSILDIRVIREMTASRNVVGHKSNYASVTVGIRFSKPRIR